jgi:hypothetical protein
VLQYSLLQILLAPQLSLPEKYDYDEAKVLLRRMLKADYTQSYRPLSGSLIKDRYHLSPIPRGGKRQCVLQPLTYNMALLTLRWNVHLDDRSRGKALYTGTIMSAMLSKVMRMVGTRRERNINQN